MLFARAGAEVIKCDGPRSDPFRTGSASGADLGGQDGALLRYLDSSRRSVIGSINRAHRWLERAAPALDQQSAEMLGERGLGADRIEVLGLEGVIGDGPEGPSFG